MTDKLAETLAELARVEAERDEARQDAEINLKAAERNFDALKRVEAERDGLRRALESVASEEHRAKGLARKRLDDLGEAGAVAGALLQERDAAIARAEKAEAERDGAVADLRECGTTLGLTIARAEKAEADRDWYRRQRDESNARFEGVWQRAKAQERERCAKAAEHALSSVNPNEGDYYYDGTLGTDEAAGIAGAAIRALPPLPEEGT
jgi:hypothetical protein